jgi:hypothetical protein
MIPYADLERAIVRWKNRQAGAEPAGAVPEEQATTGEVEADAYAEVVQETSSGVIQLEGETELDDEG